MPRKKITEYKAKSILFDHLNLPYKGISLNAEDYKKQITKASSKELVIKVDQGVKKRFKNGLIGINVKKSELSKFVSQFLKKGYTNYIIEEIIPHKREEEKYLALEQVREGILVYYSKKGGVDIEDDHNSVERVILKDATDSKTSKISKDLGINEEFFCGIVETFIENYFAFLEINPLVVINGKAYILDLAVEVDSAASYFARNWNEHDMLEENLSAQKTEEEKQVEKLASKSTASFRLNILNPNGSIFMLLSGGGASIVLADEAFQRGWSKEIANYGEYSGNPNTEETYIYAKTVLQTLLKSKSKQKILVIAGGVANFTDVHKTFQGIIKALDGLKDELKKQKVKVFVRRGGPNEEKGLSAMKSFLEKSGLLGAVYGSEIVLTDIINLGIKHLKNSK